MKRQSYVSLFAILFFVLALRVFGASEEAAAPKQPGTLSLEQCIQLAMRNQLDVILAQNNVTVAKSRAAQARSAYFPQLSIQNNTFVTGSGSVLSKATTGTAFNITQSIFDGGLREANVLSARYGIAQNTARLTRTIQTVTFNVTKAYYEVLRAKQLAVVAESNVKYTEELRKQVMARIEVQEAAKVDVLPVEAQLANARVNLVSAQNAVRIAALELRRAMGVAPQESFDILPVEPVTSVEIKSLDEYVSAALGARPDIAETKAISGATRASVRAARINLYPRPVITGQYQRQIQGGFTTSGTQIIGGIVFDLFNGGANRAAYKEAVALQANAAQQEAQIVKDVALEVEEAYLNLTSSKERLDAAKVGLEAARTNYEVQKERYDEGLAVTLDLLNAEVQLTTAEANEVQARYDYYTALAQLDYAIGGVVHSNNSYRSDNTANSSNSSHSNSDSSGYSNTSRHSERSEESRSVGDTNAS